MEKVRIQDDLYTFVNQAKLEELVIPDDMPVAGGFAALGTDATLYEGVGEAAFWSATTGELLVYVNEYSLGVAVVCADTTMTEAYTRQIAEIMVGALQPQ